MTTRSEPWPAQSLDTTLGWSFPANDACYLPVFLLGGGRRSGSLGWCSWTSQPAACFHLQPRTCTSVWSAARSPWLGFGAPCWPNELGVGWSACVCGVELLGQLQGVFPISCWRDVMVGLQCGNTLFPVFQCYCKRPVRRPFSEVGWAIK